MRPIAGKEIRITKAALAYSRYETSELRLIRVDLREAVNKAEAAIAKTAIRRVLRIRHGDNWREEPKR